MNAAASVSPGGTVSAVKAAPYAAADPEFWPVIEGHEYALHDAHCVSEAWVRGLRAAADDAWRIFSKIASLASALDEETLEEMGFPRSSVPLLTTTLLALPVLFGRFDFIESHDGFKLLEFNAETPFFWTETHRINAFACAQHGLIDPNADAESQTIATMRHVSAAFPDEPCVVVTASNVYREDYFTAVYLASLWQRALNRAVDVAPIHELQADESGLFWQGRHIDVLHRCYPLEYMATDSGGRYLPQLVARDRLVLVNPPSALFVQNKLTQALIWGLYERAEYFDGGEREAIRRVFLPTYADAPASGTWVRKPALGREGGGIAILRDGATLEATPAPAYETQPVVYQAYVEAPKIQATFSGGERRTMHALATCAISGGHPTAVGMRLGATRITDGWAHFQPLGIVPSFPQGLRAEP